MNSSSRRRELRILIDECLPVQVRHFFPGHDVRTVMHMAWRSLKDGELLSAAERDEFDVFVTADAGIPKNHDIKGWRLAIVVVPTNRRQVLAGITTILREAVEAIQRGECRIIPRRLLDPRRNR
jgi:predicted nuclease of predicted toxin-antitoxin system